MISQGAEILAILKNLQATAKEDIGEVTEQIDDFLKRIDSIGTDKVPVVDDNDAIEKYTALLAEISIALRGENLHQIEKVICSINCHIAMRYSNLGEVEKAFKKLDEIDPKAAEESKIYHYVNAVIIISHHIVAKYDVAKQEIDKAMELDSNYHRAKLVGFYLDALLGKKTIEDIISQLDSAFEPIVSLGEKKDLIAEYYVYRAFIYKEFDDETNALFNHQKAKEFGYDEAVSDYNISLSHYALATVNVPKEKRVFAMDVDKIELSKVVETLKPYLMADQAISNYLKTQMVGIYVSSCAILGIKHNLNPISDYIKLPGLNYEVIRLIILDSDKKISDEEIDVLQGEDKLLANVLNRTKENDYDGVKNLFLSLKEDEYSKLSQALVYMFLQICVVSKDIPTYWEYRRLIEAPIKLDLHECLDAYAYEEEGDVDKAKVIVDKYAIASEDYQLLSNLSLFYARNNLDLEREALLMRLLELKNDGRIYIEDLVYFYGQAIAFLIKIKSENVEGFIDALDVDGADDLDLLRIKADYFNEINDVVRLTKCVEEIYNQSPSYKNGRNKVACLTKLMRYEEALGLAQSLYRALPEEKLKERAEMIWTISELYLFLNDNDKSFEWAKLAHELFIDNPSNPSHQSYLARATRTGHTEALSDALEYKEKHPVVTGEWLKEIRISDKDDNIVETLKEGIAEVSGETHKDYETREREIAQLYRTNIVTNSLLLRYYNGSLSNFFIFASKNKITISNGDLEAIQKEQELIGDNLCVDFMSLVFLQRYDCLDTLKKIKNIHICYSTLSRLQSYIDVLDAGFVVNILKWIQEADNVIFEVDGFMGEEKDWDVLSKELLVSICVAERKSIPLLTVEPLISQLKKIKEYLVPQNVNTVSIPALCNVTMQDQPEQLAKMRYNLLAECSFVSFSAETILKKIEEDAYIVSETTLNRFFICQSSYDMMSFARVYMHVVRVLSEKHFDSGIDFAVLVLRDALKIWKRGSYYRYVLEFIDAEDAESLYRSTSIDCYLLAIYYLVKGQYKEIPERLKSLHGEVYEITINSISKKVRQSFLKQYGPFEQEG